MNIIHFHAIGSQLEVARNARASARMALVLERHHENLLALEGNLTGMTARYCDWDTVSAIRYEIARAADAMSGDVFDWFTLISARPMSVPA